MSFFSINKILKNFKNSNLKYILLTNSPKSAGYVNKDIINGLYRDLDLFKAPLFLPNNYLYKFSDTFNPYTDELDQEMILWQKDKLLENLNLH